MVLRILALWLFLYCSYSRADVCLPNTEGLCEPGVTVVEDIQVEITEEDLGTEIVTTTTTTTTTTTQTVTNEDSGNILDGDNNYVISNKEGDMDIDWGGQGPASMPSGNTCGQLGTDKCAQITGSGNSTSSMGVTGMGTTFINSVDISDLNIERGGEVRYTIEVDKRDAQDRIYMHITGRNGKTNIFQGTDILSETGVASGYQSYNGSFDFSGTISTVIIEVGGRDINLAIGPLFDDVTVNVLYNVVSTLIEQEITTLEQIYYLNIFDPTELDFVEEVFEFNDISVDDGEINFTPIEPEPEEITFASVELEIAEFELELPEPEVEIVEVETEVELEIEIEIEEIEVVEAEPEEETIEESQEELQEPEQETPQTVQKEEDQEEKIEEEKPSKPKLSNKEKAATKIVKKIDDKARYDESNQMKTLIVMQILGDTKAFFDAQSVIQDTNVEEYLLKTLEDKYGILFNNSQNNTMERMINGQY
tara:strand:+ start:1647 stop:3083 length:1437 start_codon:yes stop_codon:yes gene_type:complete